MCENIRVTPPPWEKDMTNRFVNDKPNTGGGGGGGQMQYWVAETFHCLGNRGTSKFISGKQWNQYHPLGDMWWLEIDKTTYQNWA